MLLLFGCMHNVDISVVGAQIAPTMANSAAWDGPDNVPAEAMGLLTSALAHVDPTGQLGAAVEGGVSTVVKPDVAGTATLSPGPDMAPTTVILPVVNDTLSPVWLPNAAVKFSAVALNGKSVLRLTLVDKDVQTDDPIGTVEISGSELLRAEGRGTFEYLDLSAATSGQLKSVSVVVERSK